MAWILALLAAAASPTLAGTVTGVVRDATTGFPLAGIDIDVFDDRLRLDDAFVVSSGANGAYSINGVNGDIYVRADATVAQGKADQFWPNTFLPSQAQLISVGSGSTVSGIDFDLVGGVTLEGWILASDTTSALAGVDLDLLDPTGLFISGVDGFSAGDGSFSLGLVPPGQYFVKADPTLAQGYVPVLYPDSHTLAGASLITVGTTPVTGLSFTLRPGGAISGTVVQASNGAPVVDLDLDLYGILFNELDDFDALTDEFGFYTFGTVPVGTYYVLADAIGLQPYEDLFYGQSPIIQGATPITVAKGQNVTGIDISLTLRGFISGRVIDANTTAPLAGLDIDVLSPAGVNLPEFDAETSFDGTYRIGPLPAGNYLVRADAAPADPYVDQYHPGTFRLSGGTAVTVGNSVVPNIDFALTRGGWIRGTTSLAADGSVVGGVDLDVFFPDGEAIPSVDADTDSLGQYRMGPVPTGGYVVRADPSPIMGLEGQYWSQSTTLGLATPIQVLVGLDTPGIDFPLVPLGPTATPLAQGSGPTILQAPTPNPFSHATVLRLRLGERPLTDLQVYDLRGRRVRTLLAPDGRPGTELLVRWDGLDDRGHALASGVYFLRLGTRSNDPTLKILRVR